MITIESIRQLDNNEGMTYTLLNDANFIMMETSTFNHAPTGTETFTIDCLQHDYAANWSMMKYVDVNKWSKENNNAIYVRPKNCGKRLRSTAKRPKRRTKAGWIQELHPTKGWRIIGK